MQTQLLLAPCFLWPLEIWNAKCVLAVWGELPMAGAHVSLSVSVSDTGLARVQGGPVFVTLVPQSLSVVLGWQGVCVGSGLAGAHGDTAGAVTHSAAVSEPSAPSGCWRVAVRAVAAPAVAAAVPHLPRVMAGQHRGCASTVGSACCLLAGAWIVGPHGHRVPTWLGSLGVATQHPLT